MEASPRETNGRTEDGTPERLRAPRERAERGAAPAPRESREPRDEPPAPLPEQDAAPDVDDLDGGAERSESYGELRPPRRLRLTQFLPIVVLSLLGSLMFAFPLAFAFDETGAVVAMLGLLLGSSAAGWGLMAARRVGYGWPGLPPRGSGRRPDWRVLLLYGGGLLVLLALAVLRVAALR